jgi:GNAT superfamily N-acetyltransferase
LIAIGGLNHDPYHDAQEKIGRLCRFYIHPQYRRKGIGAYLLEYIE